MPEKPEPGSFPDTAILDEDGFMAPREYCILTNHASPSGVLPLDDVPLTRPSPACSVPRVTAPWQKAWRARSNGGNVFPSDDKLGARASRRCCFGLY